MSIDPRSVWLALAAVALVRPLQAGQLICHFETSLDADVNDFGARAASGEGRLSPAGTGCPADPGGRAFEAHRAEGRPGYLEFPVSTDADFTQGTFECWVKPDWDWQVDRDQHSFLYLKLGGGHWESICLYHHGRMGDALTLAFNIHDGVDNCVLTTVDKLGWRAGEWHHVAASWTPYGEWLFGDGKLVATRRYDPPMYLARPSGPLRVAPPGIFGADAKALIDEVRVTDRPLYAGLESFPLPTTRLPHTLPGGVAGVAAAVIASSTAPSVAREKDVPALRSGTFGDGVWIDQGDLSWARLDLPEPARVAAVRWSRDGRPLTGAEGWAKADALPRDFVIEASADGATWQPVAEQTDFWYTPDQIPREGMVFEQRFDPVEARSLRLRVVRGHDPPLGPRVMLDELQVLDEAGHNLAASRVVAARTSTVTTFAPEQVLDGRIGEASCWRAASPGEAWVELRPARPVAVQRLRWSPSTDGVGDEGTPRDLVVEAQVGGTWREVGRVMGNTSPGRHELPLVPVTAEALRVRVLATADGKAATIDELAFD